MLAPKMESKIAAEDLESAVETSLESQKQANNRRRLSDAINSKGRKLKLDRRVEQRDRRTTAASEYTGPARRKTIDQRENFKDRRSEG